MTVLYRRDIRGLAHFKGVFLQVAVMSYSAKFASTFYGPFRYDIPH